METCRFCKLQVASEGTWHGNPKNNGIAPPHSCPGSAIWGPRGYLRTSIKKRLKSRATFNDDELEELHQSGYVALAPTPHGYQLRWRAYLVLREATGYHSSEEDVILGLRPFLREHLHGLLERQHRSPGSSTDDALLDALNQTRVNTAPDCTQWTPEAFVRSFHDGWTDAASRHERLDEMLDSYVYVDA